MRFLADESCDFAVVGALRDSGHDVLAVAQTARGAKDSEVIGLAREGERVLLTEDKDFGQLVYAGGQGGTGVVLANVFPLPSSSWSRAGCESGPCHLDPVHDGPLGHIVKEEGEAFVYECDLGDSWQHQVLVEEVRFESDGAEGPLDPAAFDLDRVNAALGKRRSR